MGDDMRSAAVGDWSRGFPRMWAWQSTSPGNRVNPLRSMTRASAGRGGPAPMLRIRPLWTTTTALEVTVPVRTSRSLAWVRAIFSRGGWAGDFSAALQIAHVAPPLNSDKVNRMARNTLPDLEPRGRGRRAACAGFCEEVCLASLGCELKKGIFVARFASGPVCRRGSLGQDAVAGLQGFGCVCWGWGPG